MDFQPRYAQQGETFTSRLFTHFSFRARKQQQPRAVHMPLTTDIFNTVKRIVLTSICHGEAISQFDHIHLRNQFRDILVM